MRNSELNVYGTPLHKIASELQTDGVYQAFSKELAQNSVSITEKIKKLSCEDKYAKYWVSPMEFRLFNAMEHLEIDFPFDTKLVKYLASEMFGQDKHFYYNLMANMVKAGDIGSGGGWHRDTRFSKEFKVILYLSDVDDQQGPFEFIKRSQKRAMGMFHEILTGTFSKNRYSTASIEKFVRATCAEKVKLTGNAGTINIANTVGLHRGSPVENGYRFALTLYLSKKKISTDLQRDLLWCE